MENIENTISNTADAIVEGLTETTETIKEEITPGPLGCVWNKMKKNPFRTLLITAAAGGAGYVAYDCIKHHATKEDIEEAGELVAASLHLLAA